jgi:molybdate transport system ATP-binding protein
VNGLSVRLLKRLPGFTLDTDWAAGDGITVLFGYSGAGKSLTLSMIAGLERPDVGRVLLGGDVLVDTEAGVWVPPQRRGIGYVSQSPDLFPHMTVRGNVEYGLPGVPRAERTARAQEMIAALGLGAHADKHPAALSGGQRQRTALARALVRRPRSLLLDEPFTALDLPVRREMRAVVRDVHDRFGVPVVMVTHDLEEANEADTLVVYSGTGVVQCGRPAALRARPGTPEIGRLLSGRPGRHLRAVV